LGFPTGRRGRIKQKPSVLWVGTFSRAIGLYARDSIVMYLSIIDNVFDLSCV